jgi:hypothetical protein
MAKSSTDEYTAIAQAIRFDSIYRENLLLMRENKALRERQSYCEQRIHRLVQTVVKLRARIKNV